MLTMTRSPVAFLLEFYLHAVCHYTRLKVTANQLKHLFVFEPLCNNAHLNITGYSVKKDSSRLMSLT